MATLRRVSVGRSEEQEVRERRRDCMASDAVRQVKAIGEEGERWSADTWSRGHFERLLLGSIAVAVQRGNVPLRQRLTLAMVTGFSSMTSTPGVPEAEMEAGEDVGE